MTVQSTDSHTPRYTIPLDSPSSKAIHRVGAKASRLAEMGLNGFSIPSGFVITTDAFFDFCRHNGFLDTVQKWAADPAVKQDILNGEFPLAMKKEILKSAETFSFNAYAVRSSATMEDSAHHSMAGQLETFLNTPKEHLLIRIKTCWASMFGDAIGAYAQKSKMSVAPSMGVIIQEQIDSVVAGVLFTMDPVTQSADHLILEWVMGLGDRLVSGSETPERRYFRRNTPVQVQTENMPSVLSAFLDELLSQALEVEKLFQDPLDIEWCITQTGPVFLQARPITGISGKDRVIWTNVNMVENFPDVLAPFSWSIVDTFYIHYTHHMMRLFSWSEKQLFEARSIVNNFTGIQAGRIYYNLSNWYSAAHLLPFGHLLKRLLNSFIGQNVPMGSTAKPTPKGRRSAMQSILFWLRIPILFCAAGHHIREYEKQFYAHRNRWRRSPYGKRSLVELLDVLDSVLHGFVNRYYFNPAMVDLLSAIFPGGLKLLTKKWLSSHFGNTDLLSVQLMQGINIKSVEPAGLIQLIADGISSDPELKDLLIQKDYVKLEECLPSALKERLNHFMFRFGGRCYHDCTMATPTFEERHDLFWQLVDKYQRAKHTPASNGAGRSVPPGARVKRALKHFSWGRKLIFLFVLKQAHRAIGLRERSRIIRSLLFGEIRHIALAMGRKLVEKGHLIEDEDVFFLHWSEIKEIAHGKYQFPETIPDLIRMRKKAFEQNNGVDPPSLFIRDQSTYFEVQDSLPSNRASSVAMMSGTAVSGGRITAVAKVVLDPVDHNTLEPGEILVARATDPGWTPLFRIAGGLILEKGGMLSHGAIVAREFGIPAIANVEDATTLINDGQILSINGDTGKIRVVPGTQEGQ